MEIWFGDLLVMGFRGFGVRVFGGGALGMVVIRWFLVVSWGGFLCLLVFVFELFEFVLILFGWCWI